MMKYLQQQKHGLLVKQPQQQLKQQQLLLQQCNAPQRGNILKNWTTAFWKMLKNGIATVSLT